MYETDESSTKDLVPGSRSNASAGNEAILSQGEPNSVGTESVILLKTNMHQKLSKYKKAFTNRSIIVDSLSILFGIGSWIGVNSIFLQLPLLVESAPEKWTLPSYLVVIVQFANIGPLGYTILQKFSPKKVRDAYMIYVVLVIGTIAAVLTAFMYKNTATITGHEYSLSLFILVFFLALIGCTSSVLFMPYMGRFKEIYLVTYLIGEGLSGFLPSVVALIQGVGGNVECIPNNTTEGPAYTKYVPPPRFSTKEFFLFVFSMMLFSSIAFILLDKLKKCKEEYAAVKISHGNDYVYETNDHKFPDERPVVQETRKTLSTNNYRLLMVLMALTCFFGNGVFPSIQSYSCLPYGNIAYHLTVALSSIANPVACFLAVFLPHTSIRSILTLTGCAAIFCSYALTTSLLSPSPPLVGQSGGEALVVICWTILIGLVSYIKLCITTVMRSQGGKSLVWVGAVAQTGSAVGSIIIFAFINYTKLFLSFEPC